MKIKLFSILISISFLCSFLNVLGQTMNIRINQLGYYPEGNKIAIVVWSRATMFNVKKASDGSVVYSGKLSQSIYSSDANDSVKQADFSEFVTPGSYYIDIPGFGSSLSFEISNNVLKKVAFGSLKSFYYQRCSYELKKEFAGLWDRPAGHPDTACVFHSSTGRKGKKASQGGWYDAGDYGKYTVNAGISVANLLQAYEISPGYFGDSPLHIPESGNKKNDLLDEVKFELDWLWTMQDEDGGVFHKITTLKFPGFIKPVEDTATRFFVGKPTAAALDFAAVMAMAGRIYADYDALFAKKCIEKSEKAWLWAKEHPAILFKNPSDVFTGEYGDSDVSDEFIWAAAELLITTGKVEYKTYLESKSGVLNYEIPDWTNVKGLAILSLATHKNNLGETLNSSIKKSIISKSDSMMNEIRMSPYRITNSGFGWGYTSVYANAGICLVYGYLLTKDLKYIKAAGEIADYLFGKNATAYSFFTLYGHKTPMHIHHRPSASDGIVQPVPGLLSGGPNPGRQDHESYAFTQPAKSYVDTLGSYASNEVAINWNASATALLVGIDQILGGSSEEMDFKPILQAGNPPFVTLQSFASNAFNKNQPIHIIAQVSDPIGISKAEIYVDSKFAGMKKEPPFEWSFMNLPAGTHTISVSMINNKEMVTEKAMTVIVKDAD